ncbi:MAG: DUF1338 domain-containing protein [Draconibacterium sp.]|jgi:hypothetical protein
MKRTTKEITEELFNRLWLQYIERVPYAKTYADLVTAKGGTVVNDHIAFRTFNTHTGEQPEGIRAIKHILNFLEYKSVEKYKFTKTMLNAVHFEHPDEMLPKIFVSQLEVDQLPEWAQEIVKGCVKDTLYLLSDKSIELLNILKNNGWLPLEAADYLLDDLVNYFRRPWNIPAKDSVLKINDVSQYGAWVLLHGNSVNHFTAYINYQNVKQWPDLETTCKALAEAGVPMKETMEGEKGSKLQQSSTLAVKEEVKVRTENGIEKIIWTYAYYELAERGFITENGNRKLFSGFLGEQAVHLFDMTKTRDN